MVTADRQQEVVFAVPTTWPCLMTSSDLRVYFGYRLFSTKYLGAVRADPWRE